MEYKQGNDDWNLQGFGMENVWLLDLEGWFTNMIAACISMQGAALHRLRPKMLSLVCLSQG